MVRTQNLSGHQRFLNMFKDTEKFWQWLSHQKPEQPVEASLVPKKTEKQDKWIGRSRDLPVEVQRSWLRGTLDWLNSKSQRSMDFAARAGDTTESYVAVEVAINLRKRAKIIKGRMNEIDR